MTILTRLSLVQQQIAHAVQDAQRPPNSVQLLAVSKTFPVDCVLQAYEAGQRMFGENYVQEGIEKITALAHVLEPIEWHLIGPLQSNKTRVVAENFSWVQSIDRLKVAQRLSEQRPEHLPALNLCVQVNVSDESSKSGVPIQDTMALAHAIQALPRVRLRGLMAIPQATQDTQSLAHAFDVMHQLFNELTTCYPQQIDTLSMGMSADMGLAIQHGATMVRVGTAIFGKR